MALHRLAPVTALALLLASACSSEPSADRAGASAGVAEADAKRAEGQGTPEQAAPSGPLSPERALVAKLGLPPRFLVGLGNDLPPPEANFDYTKSGIYTLPAKLDIHYVYLSGLPGQGGWPDHDPNGTYVNVQADIAAARGIAPMFTLYQAAAWGENDFEAVKNPDFMGPYWEGARLLFERLAIFGKPAIVHFEPDFWGYAQKRAKGGDPATVPVLVSSLVSECSGLPDDVAGMGRCLVRLARTLAPKVVVGFQASTFGANDAPEVAAFLKKVGADEADLTVVETLDRDAGCFERKVDPNCQRNDGTYYWDEENVRHPNFHDHLAWARAIRDGVGKPLLWWQMPLGVPSDAPGGNSGRYRDNRVRYLFAHPEEFVAAGGIGAAFGEGAENQTTIFTDGGQFSRAVVSYYKKPAPLP